MAYKLFIPGPTEVNEEVREKMSVEMMGHRSKTFSVLYDQVSSKLKKMLGTQNRVFLSTSSALGVMEACVRNLVKNKSLNLVCGAFSDRWYKMVGECGKQADKIEVEWGRAIKPEMVDEKLKTGQYDTLFITHNETSTGVMNPIAEIMAVARKYPDIVVCVDAVSSLAGAKIEVDKLGLDVCLASVQKSFALPPGLAIFSCSQKAIDRSKEVEGRGYYFDFQMFVKYDDKSQTISTPSIAHINALNYQLDRILAESMDKREARLTEMAEYTRQWALDQGFELFSEPGYESVTLTCIKNNLGIDVAAVINQVKELGMEFGNGYGKVKGQAFRIAHMGDLCMADIKAVTGAIAAVIGSSTQAEV